MELVRADEYLKNAKGYLGLTPLHPVTGWKLQYENSPEKGMSLYFTPVKAGIDGTDPADCGEMESGHQAVPIHGLHLQAFLGEAPTLENPRSTLR